MANFTGQPISGSYYRVLQIDSGSIQDGLGNFITSATIGSLTGSFSGSLDGIATSASYIESASYALSSSNALSASYVESSSYALTSSYSETSSYAESSSYSQTASYVENAVSSSYTLTASYAENTGIPIDTGSFVTTSSFDNYTGSISSQFAGTSSYALTASYAENVGSSSLTTGILTNVTVGALTSGTNLPVGTSLESIFQQMLVTYIPPTLSGLAMRNGGSTISTAARDVNDSFIVNTASFSATADNPTGIFPLSSSWTSSGADIGTQIYYFGDNVLSNSNILSVGSNYTINKSTTAGSVSFIVNGRRSDNGAAISATSTSVPFRFRNYFAASSTVITDNSTAQTVINTGLITSALDTDKAWNVTCTSANNVAGNFTYIIYPSSYGTLSGIIQNGALPVLTAFTDLGNFNITTAYGVSLSVKIYKSNSDQAFSPGTTLAIT